MRGVSAALAVETANDVLREFYGAAVSQHARAVYLKNQVLTIACLNSVAAQEIKLNETRVLERLNQKLPVGLVKKIRYLS